MKIISQLNSMIFLYSLGEFPLLEIYNPKNLDEIRNIFSFSQIDNTKTTPNTLIELNFLKGFFNNTIIDSMKIIDRKVILTVFGDKENTNLIFNEFNNYINSIILNFDNKINPKLIVFESVIKFQTNKNFINFFNNKLIKIFEIFKRYDPEISSFTINEFKGIVDYNIDQDLLKEYRITRSSKQFTFTLQDNIQNNIITSKLPFDSDTHIEILKKLENILSE